LAGTGRPVRHRRWAAHAKRRAHDPNGANILQVDA
jgi:hypothetical protein